MAGLALPTAATPSASPAKDKKRKRATRPKDDDSDAELEVSAEDLVAAGDDGDGDGDGDGEGGGGRRRGGGGGEGGDGGEDGEDEDDESAAAAAAAGAAASAVQREAQRRRQQTLLLRGVLDEEQGKRFDVFRSVVIPRQVVKKLNKDLFDQNVPNNLTSVVAGMVKVFIADVVETGRELQEDPSAPLTPYHLQLARIKLQERGLLRAPTGSAGSDASRPRKRLFRR